MPSTAIIFSISLSSNCKPDTSCQVGFARILAIMTCHPSRGSRRWKSKHQPSPWVAERGKWGPHWEAPWQLPKWFHGKSLHNSKIMIKFKRTKGSVVNHTTVPKIIFRRYASHLASINVWVTGIYWSIHLPLGPCVEVISPCPTRSLTGASNPTSGPFVSVTKSLGKSVSTT